MKHLPLLLSVVYGVLFLFLDINACMHNTQSHINNRSKRLDIMFTQMFTPLQYLKMCNSSHFFLFVILFPCHHICQSFFLVLQKYLFFINTFAACFCCLFILLSTTYTSHILNCVVKPRARVHNSVTCCSGNFCSLNFMFL